MGKRLTFDSLTYCIDGDDYEIRFDDRRLSFRGPGFRTVVGMIAGQIGWKPAELRSYIMGLREMRRLVKRQVRNLENVRRFCGPEHRRQLSGPDPEQWWCGYLQALKDVERLCGKGS